MSAFSANAAGQIARVGTVVRTLPFVGDDTALANAMCAGNPSAVSAFYDRYHAHVTRILSRVLGAERDLSDLHHDVFVRALTSVHEIKNPSALKAWLTSIAIFTARTHILRRSRRRWLQFLPWHDLPEVEAATPSGEVTEALRATYALLDELPADERIAFALRFIDGMELTEVAAACGVSLPTIKRRLSRGQAQFAAMAREHPALKDWLQGGARWGTSTER